jgi:hypothetical protein
LLLQRVPRRPATVVVPASPEHRRRHCPSRTHVQLHPRDRTWPQSPGMVTGKRLHAGRHSSEVTFYSNINPHMAPSFCNSGSRLPCLTSGAGGFIPAPVLNPLHNLAGRIRLPDFPRPSCGSCGTPAHESHATQHSCMSRHPQHRVPGNSFMKTARQTVTHFMMNVFMRAGDLPAGFVERRENRNVPVRLQVLMSPARPTRPWCPSPC